MVVERFGLIGSIWLLPSGKTKMASAVATPKITISGRDL